jgi:hypothetical protein
MTLFGRTNAWDSHPVGRFEFAPTGRIQAGIQLGPNSVPNRQARDRFGHFLGELNEQEAVTQFQRAYEKWDTVPSSLAEIPAYAR